MAQLGFKGALRPVFAAAVLSAARRGDGPGRSRAGSPPQPSVDTVQPSPGEAWVKVCAPDPTTNKQLCQVIQQLAADTGQFIASVNIKTLEGEPKIVFAAAMRMPTSGVLVAPGMRAQIDGGKQYEVKYSICYPDVCYADMEVDDTFITALKAGGQLTLIALTQQGSRRSPSAFR